MQQMSTHERLLSTLTMPVARYELWSGRPVLIVHTLDSLPVGAAVGALSAIPTFRPDSLGNFRFVFLKELRVNMSNG
jgi:hypothetical protein